MEIPDSEIKDYLLPSSTENILKNEGIDENFDECSICRGERSSESNIVTPNCGHKHHENCLTEWINTSAHLGPTCPVCRYLMIREDYKFWFKLGRETCNMSRWSDYCSQIISANFGKSSKYVKFFPYNSPFLGVQANLDSLIQQSYNLDEDADFNTHLQKYLKTSERVNCCDVFYNIGTITKPDIPHPTGKRYPKTITSQQKCYIDQFRGRLKLFLNYLDYIVDNMKTPKNTMRWKETTGRNSMKDFVTSVNKMKKWHDKMVVLDELNLS